MDRPNGCRRPPAPAPAPLPPPGEFPLQSLRNHEAEEGVLGSVLQDNHAYDLPGVAALAPGDFYSDERALLWRTMTALLAAGRPVDQITLADALEAAGELEKVGGPDALADLQNQVPHAANAAYYAAIVRAKAVARRLADAARETLGDVAAMAHTADALVDRAASRVLAVADSSADERVVPLGAAVDRAVTRLHRRAGDGTGLSLGFSDVDDLVCGLEDEQVMIVAARPSMGKSSFALNVCLNAAAGGRHVLLVSLEAGAEDVAERMIVMRSGVDSRALKRPRAAFDDRAVSGAIDRACEEVGRLPMTVDDTPARTVAGVSILARRLKRTRGLGLVVCDYLQLFAPEDPRRERHEQVAAMSRGLKDLARDLRVPMIVLSQLNREVEKRKDFRPRMSDLRESGSVEQDADVVVLLHRPEYYKPGDSPNVCEVNVAKNRNGPTDTVSLRWDGPTYRFQDLAPYGWSAPPAASPY